MNAKQKAIEIFDKYYSLNIPLTMNDAKQCALICVNEMIEQNGELYLINASKETIDYYMAKNAFLFEIKTEIEKL